MRSLTVTWLNLRTSDTSGTIQCIGDEEHEEPESRRHQSAHLHQCHDDQDVPADSRHAWGLLPVPRVHPYCPSGDGPCRSTEPEYGRAGIPPTVWCWPMTACHVLWQTDDQTPRVSWKYACRADAPCCHPFAHNDIVDKIHLGDRVNITGIYPAVPIESAQGWVMWSLSTKPSLMSFIIRKWMQSVSPKEMKKQNRNFFSEKHVELLKKLSRKPDIYERLASASGPST